MEEMIVVTNIDYVRVKCYSDLMCRLQRPYTLYPLISNKDRRIDDQLIEEEWVRGQRFRTPNGDFVIGVDKEISDLFQVHWDGVKRVEAKLSTLERSYRELHQEFDRLKLSHRLAIEELTHKDIRLGRISSMSFWNRFKFLFTGKVS